MAVRIENQCVNVKGSGWDLLEDLAKLVYTMRFKCDIDEEDIKTAVDVALDKDTAEEHSPAATIDMNKMEPEEIMDTLMNIINKAVKGREDEDDE